jgi:hypothetical protein
MAVPLLSPLSSSSKATKFRGDFMAVPWATWGRGLELSSPHVGSAPVDRCSNHWIWKTKFNPSIYKG